MKKYLIILTAIALKGNMAKAQDAATLVPFLAEMVAQTGMVLETLDRSEEQLEKIQKTVGEVKDFQEFLNDVAGVREAINMLACAIESLNEGREIALMQQLGLPSSNLFSEFMQCQYDIYYQTLDLDMLMIQRNIQKGLDMTEDLSLVDRLDLINEALREINNVRMRTVSTKGALLDLMYKHMEAKKAEDWYELLNRI